MQQPRDAGRHSYTSKGSSGKKQPSCTGIYLCTYYVPSRRLARANASSHTWLHRTACNANSCLDSCFISWPQPEFLTGRISGVQIQRRIYGELLTIEFAFAGCLTRGQAVGRSPQASQLCFTATVISF